MGGTRQGGCRCGKVRFEVSGEPLLTMAPVTGAVPVARIPKRPEPCANGPSRSPSLSLSVGVKSSTRLIALATARGGVEDAAHRDTSPDHCVALARGGSRRADPGRA